jgi:large conductance mechanosensitive channel
MIADFKKFLLRGNVLDLAVAVIVGAAFGAIVTSLITDIVTPLLLQPAMQALGVDELEKVQWQGIRYGRFLASVITFLATALIVFLMIQAVHRLRNKEDAQPVVVPPLSRQEQLLEEIRDLLKKP